MTDVYIEPKDYPGWLKLTLRDMGYKPKMIRVIPTDYARVGRSWHERNRETVFVNGHDNCTRRYDGSWGGQNAYATGVAKAVDEGIAVPMTPTIMVAVFSTYPKSVKLYVHPDVMPKYLPPVDEMDPEELLVLTCIKCLIPRARREAFARYTTVSPGFFDQALPDLIARGFLNKNKSISAKGRNVVGDMRPETVYDDLVEQGRLKWKD